jgi:DNA-binding transcriptional LysR family regulator
MEERWLASGLATTATSGIDRPENGMIELDDFRTFVAVAREGSFVAASRKTGIPTSTVSRAIARLEERLGVRLFHRTSRRVAASAEGERLLARVAPLVDGLATVAAEARDQGSELVGPLRVTAPVVSGAGWIGKALASFAEAHPRVQVELHLSNAVVDVIRERYDLGFRAGPIEDLRLVARRIWSMAFVLAASPAFVERELSGRRSISREQLERLPSILHVRNATWTFENGEVVRPRERFCADDPRVALDAAALGMGLVRSAKNLLEGRNDLVVLSTPLGALAPRAMFAVRPSGRAPSRVRHAIEWIARHAPR